MAPSYLRVKGPQIKIWLIPPDVRRDPVESQNHSGLVSTTCRRFSSCSVVLQTVCLSVSLSLSLSLSL